MGASNRIETMLLDDFNLIINDKIYPVSPPMHIEAPKVFFYILNIAMLQMSFFNIRSTAHR